MPEIEVMKVICFSHELICSWTAKYIHVILKKKFLRCWFPQITRIRGPESSTGVLMSLDLRTVKDEGYHLPVAIGLRCKEKNTEGHVLRQTSFDLDRLSI